MKLPRVIEATAFDRFNLQLCRMAFEEPIASGIQDELQIIALRFNPGRTAGGQAASRFFLEFVDGSNFIVCQRNDGEQTATKNEFLQLIGLLGITLPGEARAPTSAATPGHPTQTAHTAQATA